MILKVHPHKIEIEKEPVNERELYVSKCYFEFDEEITDDFIKEAYFTFNGETYKQIIVNNECDFPNEVLAKKGTMEIGVVAYVTDNDEYLKRYNPSPVYFNTLVGSLKDDVENSEEVTPSDKEQMEQQILNVTQQMDNLNVGATKTEHTTTITVTKKDGTSYDVKVLDGEKGEKGDTGEPGQIKMLVINELPTVGETATLYFVPKEDAETSDLYYEYVWLNNKWELLGKKQINIDLENYYTKQETNKLLNGKADANDIPTKTSDLTNDSNFITKTYVDGLIGDIATALDTIQGEVV